MKKINTSKTIRFMMMAAAAGCVVLTPGCKKEEANVPEPIPGVSAEAQATLTELTTAARKYAHEKNKIPATLDEVVAAGYLKSIPAPPAGKRFVLDSRRVVVVLVDQ
jgi:hypothetical protein